MVKFQRGIISIVATFLAPHSRQSNQFKFSLSAAVLLSNIRLQIKIQEIVFTIARTILFLPAKQAFVAIQTAKFFHKP
jgi:hypothetical protein